MITRSTILHLRLPFSWFLLPVCLLAILSAEPVNAAKAWGAFFILHFLLYPAANGFNSFYDRDEESIGAMKRPPPVTPDLLWVSLALDAAAIAAGFAVGPIFALGCLLYGLGSKAYSHPAIRLKRYPYLGWLSAGLGQGGVVFLMVLWSVPVAPSIALDSSVGMTALAVTLLTLGIIPITQIYQHREDALRGCETISMRLGIRGTFIFSSLFTAAGAVLYCWTRAGSGAGQVRLFLFLNVPAVICLVYWFAVAAKDVAKADFRHATTVLALASTGVNLFALTLLSRNWRAWEFLAGA